ncbi:MAG: hypothetical protein DSY46_03605, partial [Hydrogenimonas sp.]
MRSDESKRELSNYFKQKYIENALNFFISWKIFFIKRDFVLSNNKLERELANYLKQNKYIENALGKFKIEKKELGKGGTSVVRRATFENNQEFAIKFLLENTKTHESKAFKRFKQAHINMLRIQNTGAILPQIHFDYLHINENITIPYIIMLKADKTLKDFKENREITFEDFEKIFNSLIELLRIIHDHGIIHRDLKPENIFFLKDRLVLGDFDIAKFDDEHFVKLHDTKKSERLANYHFSAPEQSEKSYGEITQSADLFALGQILYWLIIGQTLRGQSKINLVVYDRRYSKYQALIERLLQQEPDKRFQSIEQLSKYLKECDTANRDALELEKSLERLELFDEIINKYTPNLDWHDFQKFDNRQIINDIMKDLAKHREQLNLWWSKGEKSNYIYEIKKNYGISYFDKLKEKLMPSNKWILDGFEIDINSIWIYKYGDLGGSIIIIESKPMPSFGIFKDDYEFEEAVLFRGRYIPPIHLESGWTEYRGKRIKIDQAETKEMRIRYLHQDLFF